MKEKKARVEDALHATKAAAEEGIVPGGGVAYIRAQKVLEGLKGANEDQQVGIEIIRKAIEEPLRMIVHNAGLEGSVVLNQVKQGKDDYGFNALTEKYEDHMIAAGIIDPTKVSRIALENAASVAALLLTTEATIVEKPEKEKAPAMPPGGMGGDMY
jgi:chaperonin GroEL